MLFAAGKFNRIGQLAYAPSGDVFLLKFVGIVAESHGGGVAQLLLQGEQVAAHRQFLSTIVDDAEIEEAMGRQFGRGPRVKINLLQDAHIAKLARDKRRQLRQDRLVLIRLALQKARDKIGHRHAHAAHLLGQSLNQQLQFFAYQARHQPFQLLVVQAIEHRQGHGHGDAVEWVVWLKAISELERTIGGFEGFRKLRIGDVGGRVLHQIIAAQIQRFVIGL